MSASERLRSLLRLACKSGNGYIAERQNALEKAIAHAHKHSVDLLRIIKDLGIDLDGLKHFLKAPCTSAPISSSTNPPNHNQNSHNTYYWSNQSGDRSCKVPFVPNPRWTSERRRYRDTEVTHGFPVGEMKEFFFYSTSIVSAGYDPNNHILFLKFSDRELYRYYNVPESVVRSLISAASHGSFARRNICYSFQYERVYWPPFT